MSSTAKELERLVIKLVGEGSDYQKTLDHAVRETREASRDIDRVTKQSMGKQNRSMREAARIVESVRTPTERYKRALAKLRREHRSGAISSSTHARAIKQLNKEYEMGAFAVKKYGRSMQMGGRRMMGIGTMMTFGLTLPLAGAVASFASFDDAMTKSTAIMGNVSDEMQKKMRGTARSLALEGRQSAKELAESYYFLASAGLNAEQSVASLGTVQTFATAGAFDMSQATDLLTDAQSALGLTVKDSEKNMQGMLRVSDRLVKANTLANASVQEFSEAITSEAGAAIKQYNMDLSEGVAILATYADQGIKGNAAGSLFGRMTRLLVKALNENESAFKKLNIPYEEFGATGKNVTAVIGGITKATKGMGPQVKAATLETLGFQARTQQAILPLLGLTDEIRAYEDALENAGGITQEVADKQLTSFTSQIVILWNHIKEFSMSIGEALAPAVMWVADALKSLMQSWNALSSSTKTAIAVMFAVVGIAGPVILALGMMTTAVGHLTIAYAALNVMMGVSAKSMIMGSLAGLAALVLVPVAIWAISDAVAQMAYDTDLGFKGLTDTVEISGQTITGWADFLAIEIVSTWDWIVAKSKILWKGFIAYVVEGFAKVWRLELRKMRRWATFLPFVPDSIGEGLTNKIDKSLTNSEKRWRAYEKEVERINKDLARDMAIWQEGRAAAYDADEKRKEENKERRDEAALDIPDFEMPDFEVPDFEMPDFEVPDFEMPDLEMPDLGLPETQALEDIGKIPDGLGDTADAITELARGTAEEFRSANIALGNTNATEIPESPSGRGVTTPRPQWAGQREPEPAANKLTEGQAAVWGGALAALAKQIGTEEKEGAEEDRARETVKEKEGAEEDRARETVKENVSRTTTITREQGDQIIWILRALSGGAMPAQPHLMG